MIRDKQMPYHHYFSTAIYKISLCAFNTARRKWTLQLLVNGNVNLSAKTVNTINKNTKLCYPLGRKLSTRIEPNINLVKPSLTDFFSTLR
jgi:hypothetical protein